MSKVRDLPEITTLADNDVLYAVDESAGPNGGRKITKENLKTSVAPTAAETKAAYESNADTNAFTDAEKAKLATVEAGAAFQDADEVPYSNTVSGLSASNVQDAIDEVSLDTQADFRPSIASGRILHYTGGTVRFDGVFYELVANDILLNPNITNGEVYIDLDGLVKQTASNTLAPPYTVVFAKFSTDLNNIISLTDERVKNSQNIIRGLLADVRDVRAGAAAQEGTSGRISDAAHKHPILTGAPSTQIPDQANAEGTSANLARADHIHEIPTDAPVTIGSANTEGVADSFSRSDHVHSHGSQGGGSLHTAATQAVAGFMSPSDKLTVDKLNEIWSVTQEPTGFESRTDNTISFVDGTRTFTISPTSVSFDYWVSGAKFTISSPASVVIDNIEGLHFIYFNNSGALVADPAPADVSINRDVAFVALIYWDATNSVGVVVGDERHGIIMDWTTHQLWHDVFRAQFISGFAFNTFIVDGDGSLNTHSQFSVANGVFNDEDIQFAIVDGAPQELSPTLETPILYRSGINGNWRRKTANNIPIIYSGTAGYTGASGLLAFNEFTGVTWQLTEVSNNNYVWVHYLATNDINTPIIGIQGAAQYTTTTLARNGVEAEIQGLANLPTQEFVILGSVLFQSSTSFSNVPKARIVSLPGGSSYVDWRATHVLSQNAANDHSSLANLQSDTHQQYLNRSGVRPMTGNLDMGTNNITNVGLVDGVDVSAHGSRHNPGGSDPVTTAAAVGLTPASTNAEGAAGSLARSDHTHAIATALVGDITTIQPDDTASAGTANTFARGDHRHAIAAAAPTTQTPDQSNAEGVSTSFARADHIHNIPADAPTTNLTPASTNAEGVGSSFARNDHTHAFDMAQAGNLSTINAGDAENLGSIDRFVRADHQHPVATAAATGLSADSTNTEGASTSLARADHTHDLATGAVSTQTPDQANAEGSSANLARADHVHQIATAAPSTTLSPATANTQGVSTSFARADHIHAVATALVGDITTIQPDDAASAGTANTFARGDHRHAIAAAAPATQTPDQANAEGVSTSFARADHVHNIPADAPTTILSPATTNAEGVGTSFARNDHTHAVATALVGDITTIQPDATAAAGTANTFARGDHRHAIDAAAPVNTGTANSEGASTSFARADHVHNTTIANSVASATADDTTTSTTDVLLVGMTLTPAAGTYFATFSTSAVNSGNGATRMFFSIYVDGVQVAHSEREIGIAGGANSAVHTNAVVTVNGSQAIDVRWRAIAGTNTAHERSLTLVRLGS